MWTVSLAIVLPAAFRVTRALSFPNLLSSERPAELRAIVTVRVWPAASTADPAPIETTFVRVFAFALTAVSRPFLRCSLTLTVSVAAPPAEAPARDQGLAGDLP